MTVRYGISAAVGAPCGDGEGFRCRAFPPGGETGAGRGGRGGEGGEFKGANERPMRGDGDELE